MPKTWVGWVVYLVGGLIALLLGGAALLFFLLPRAELKGEFETQLERATGRDVAIGGDLKVAFFPVLGFRAEQVSIANVPGGQAANLAQAGSIAAGLEIMPYLLRRRIVVDRLVLVDPVISLELDAEGAPNWTLTPPPGAAPAPPTPQQPALQDFALKEIRVTGGRISYLDRRDGDSWLIENADLKSAVESLDKPIRLEGALGWKGQRVELDATVAQPRAALRGLETQLTADVRTELLTAHVEGQLAGARETFAGDVRAEGPSLRRLSAWLGPTIAPGAGLENFFVNGRLTIDRTKFAFENASLRLDALDGRGDFVLESNEGRPYVSGRLELKALDINPYLGAPPVAEGAAVTVEAAAASTIANAPDARRPWPTTPIELGVLKAVDANLELYIKGPFKAQRVQADAAELSMVLNKGFLAATLARLELYGGRGSGRIEIDAREPAVRLAQELTVQGVRANDFLRDAFGFENLEGAADVTLNWSGEGATPDALISSLDGRVTLAAREGAIRGVDLGGMARTIRNAFNGNLVNPNARTRFSNFAGTFAIADGVMATDDLHVQLPDLRVDTTGLINLGAQTMNVRIVPREGGLAVPFVVRGAWSRLDYNSDLRGRERPGIESAVRSVKARAPRPRTN